MGPRPCTPCQAPGLRCPTRNSAENGTHCMRLQCSAGSVLAPLPWLRPRHGGVACEAAGRPAVALELRKSGLFGERGHCERGHCERARAAASEPSPHSAPKSEDVCRSGACKTSHFSLTPVNASCRRVCTPLPKNKKAKPHYTCKCKTAGDIKLSQNQFRCEARSKDFLDRRSLPCRTHTTAASADVG